MMKKFRLSGSYIQNGEAGKLAGDFEVDDYGAVYGTLVDEASNVRERRIRGRLDSIDGKMVLDFIVLVPNTADNLVNLRYQLEKTGVGAVAGRYAGTWRPIEKIADFRVTGGPFELRNGDSCYSGEVEKLVPCEEDKRAQDAEIYVEKVA